MSTLTPNLSLIKPADNDTLSASIGMFRQSFDILDTAVQAKAPVANPTFVSGSQVLATLRAQRILGQTANLLDVRDENNNVLLRADNSGLLYHPNGSVLLDTTTANATFLTPTQANAAYAPISVPWQAYTPAISGSGWAIGNGTVSGRYVQMGKTVHVTVRIIFGSTSTYGTVIPQVSLPVGGTASGPTLFYSSGMLYHVATTSIYPMLADLGSTGVFVRSSGSSPAQAVTSTVPFTWATGDEIRFTATYEST